MKEEITAISFDENQRSNMKNQESTRSKNEEKQETRMMRVEMVQNIELHHRMEGEQRRRARIHNRTKMKT